MSREVAMQFGKPSDGSQNGSGSTGQNWVLLWTNPDTASAFSAQTVSLDLSGYDAVYIPMVYTSGYVYAAPIILTDGIASFIRFPSNSGNTLRYLSRSVTASSSGVSFTECTRYQQGSSSTTSNADLIPKAIYGIRFG